MKVYILRCCGSGVVVVVVVVVGGSGGGGTSWWCRQVMGKCCKLSRLVYYLTDQTPDTETLTNHFNASFFC